MTSTAFRQCRPSDREKALPLIISSGPEAFHYVFCDRQSEQLTSFLERAFVAKGNEFSHDQHLALGEPRADPLVVPAGGKRQTYPVYNLHGRSNAYYCPMKLKIGEHLGLCSVFRITI